jgi:two-component system, NtrC family, response regulator AtoC
MSVQAKLLQMLQDGSFMRVGGQESKTVNTRLISAASKDLRQQAEDGSFRLDLFFRINAVTIQLPTLRQRIVDLPMLIDYFLDLHSKAYRCSPKPLSREAMRLMQRYDWPGNIRQLENMIRSYLLIGSEEALTEDLVPSAPTGPARLSTQIDLTNPVSLKEITRAATQDLERQIILKVLEANAWSRRKTAKWLNMSYRSLLYKLQATQLSSFSGAPSKAANPVSIPMSRQATATPEDIRPMWTGNASS